MMNPSAANSNPNLTESVVIRLDRDLLRLIEEKARRNDRSRSAEIRVAVRQHVEKDAA